MFFNNKNKQKTTTTQEIQLHQAPQGESAIILAIEEQGKSINFQLKQIRDDIRKNEAKIDKNHDMLIKKVTDLEVKQALHAYRIEQLEKTNKN